MKIETLTNNFPTQLLNNTNINNVEAINSSESSARVEKNELSKREEEEISLSKKTISEAVDKANKKLLLADRKFEFSVNDETNDIIIKVINKETDEVIREIPSEKILDMVAKMMELAGLFVDERR